MSGGSWDYAYRHFEEVADRLNSQTQIPLRRALGKHIRLVAKALHDIEWVDSCDYGKGAEAPAIQKVLGGNTSKIELEVLVSDAKDLVKQLQALLSLTIDS